MEERLIKLEKVGTVYVITVNHFDEKNGTDLNNRTFIQTNDFNDACIQFVDQIKIKVSFGFKAIVFVSI